MSTKWLPDPSSHQEVTKPFAPITYRFPEVMADILQAPQLEEVQEIDPGEGRRGWTLPMRNKIAHYDMVVIEDSDFMTFETEIARVSPVQSNLYGALHDINSEIDEGKIIVERGLHDESQQEVIEYDAIHFTKQLRKRGVPKTTVIEELTAFDYGVGRVFGEVTSAVGEHGAKFLEPLKYTPPPLPPQATVEELLDSVTRGDSG